MPVGLHTFPIPATFGNAPERSGDWAKNNIDALTSCIGEVLVPARACVKASWKAAHKIRTAHSVTIVIQTHTRKIQARYWWNVSDPVSIA